MLKNLFRGSIFVLAILFLTVNFAWAQQPIPIQNPLAGGCDNISCVLQAIINFILTIAVPILVIMIIFAAFMLLTAGGNEQQVEKGRKALLWSVIGFAIVIVGWGFVYIIKQLLSCGGSGCQ